MLTLVDAALYGIIGIADTVKDGSHEAIAALRSQGLDVIIFTGDNDLTARVVARGRH